MENPENLKGFHQVLIRAKSIILYPGPEIGHIIRNDLIKSTVQYMRIKPVDWLHAADQIYFTIRELQ